MSRYTSLAISVFVACMAGSSVLADNREMAVHSQRLFYTPQERAQLLARPHTPLAGNGGLRPEKGAAEVQVTDSRLTDSAGNRKPVKKLQAAHSENLVYNARISTKEGVHILLNGLPCYRFDQPLHGMPGRAVVRLSCPHIDNGHYQIDYLVRVKKIEVYGDGEWLGRLSVGESL